MAAADPSSDFLGEEQKYCFSACTAPSFTCHHTTRTQTRHFLVRVRAYMRACMWQEGGGAEQRKMAKARGTDPHMAEHVFEAAGRDRLQANECPLLVIELCSDFVGVLLRVEDSAERVLQLLVSALGVQCPHTHLLAPLWRTARTHARTRAHTSVLADHIASGYVAALCCHCSHPLFGNSPHPFQQRERRFGRWGRSEAGNRTQRGVWRRDHRALPLRLVACSHPHSVLGGRE